MTEPNMRRPATTIHVLGSGVPTPTPDRWGTAFVVDTGADHVMFDCGPAATWKLVKMGLSPNDISALFFTHHHFDHNVDYPCFLLTRWDQSNGQENRLKVFGPRPTSEITARLIGPSGAFCDDIRARIESPASQQRHLGRGGTLPRRPPEVEVADIDGGFTTHGPTWTVATARAEHAQPYLESIAYRITTTEGSIVVCGDTAPCESLVNLATGADVLLSGVWDQNERERPAEDHGGHCTIQQAASLASTARVRRLVLVHTGPRISSPPHSEELVQQAREYFDGEILLAKELTTIQL